MKMKRTMAMVLAGTMLASVLAGCGSTSSSADGSAASNKSGLKPMTYILATRSEFQTVLSEQIMATGEKLGYEVTIQNGDSDMAKQISYVETCRNAGQEAVMVQPVDADACQSIVDAAGNMKVVFVNCGPTDMEVLSNENVCYVGADETDAGRLQGEYLAKYFKEQGKTEISYILLQGALGYVATYKRTDGCLDALKANGITATEATAPLMCEYDRPTAQENIAPLLSSGLKFDCIFANNDAMALGAVEACKQANIEINFPIIGIDCTADGAQSIKDGDMAMTVSQGAAAQGEGAVTAAYNMVNGNPINKGLDDSFKLDDSGEDWSDSCLWTPLDTVTADNVDNYL